MSIKRSKQVSRGTDNAEASSAFPSSKPAEPTFTWKGDVEGKPDDAFAPYAMTSRFQRGALVAHPKFGRGVVSAVESQRIEVLFEEGAKKLGHGAT